MKVMCISHQNYNPGLSDPNLPKPEIGEVCTVIGEHMAYDIVACYELEEYQHWCSLIRIGYDKRNFAPLTGVDETELVTEEFEEKYCVPVNGKA